jgi:hypothetical protein
VVRGIAILLNYSWDAAFDEIVLQAKYEADMPSSNAVLAAYLKRKGYTRHVLPDTCPNCYSVTDFCHEHPYGRYLLATGTHVVAVIDGNYYDAWDSGNETPIYYWKKGV